MPARPLARPPERRFRPRAHTPSLTHSARTPPPSPGTQIRVRASPRFLESTPTAHPVPNRLGHIPSFSIPRLASLVRPRRLSTVTVPTSSPNLQPPASAALALRARAQSIANITARREEAEEPLTAESELGRSVTESTPPLTPPSFCIIADTAYTLDPASSYPHFTSSSC
ncbi:hypothetical protein HETIRDRAFT_101221 [Heterobasidion irregulare TC 32-1]|uniref:Uncharacterized protein n=1 Tax=Heterobasidion irregulare (strain TC 32-1) TaxID=747525 RepID=W4KI39_HETIT|nr:uncharacterized protein HETIRDRAFT_101221 [Heterobasidion irregulare TC 32-1]ETW84985.1 hypothetical protein HETIRDRAFT_101221 [Heterobasidion irregulare TC 32-1]